jgi:hypothetical protein
MNVSMPTIASVVNPDQNAKHFGQPEANFAIAKFGLKVNSGILLKLIV